MRTIIVLLCLVTALTNCSKESINYKETSLYIEHAPSDGSNVGFIFYPGALIGAGAYNTWHREIALKGFRVFSVKFPSSLAILDVNAALRIINQNSDIDTWFIGGHSLGGAMAMQLLSEEKNLSQFDGLILYGSYPGENVNFADRGIRVLSLFGSEDGISTVEEINEGRSRLPEGIDISRLEDLLTPSQAYYLLIDGGNHSFFGNYGFQQGDGQAKITREEQQKIMVDFTAEFLNLISF